MHSLLMDGLDLIFRARGLKPLSELTRSTTDAIVRGSLVQWRNWMTDVSNSTISLLALVVAFLALAALSTYGMAHPATKGYYI